MTSSLASLTPEHPLHTMDVSLLVEHCMNELSKYQHGEASNDAYGSELFRRAQLYSDEAAWDGFQKCFTEMALTWLRRHPHRELATRMESEENYITLAFERFWLATVHNKKIEFSTLAAALNYLHASLNGALCDAMRTYMRHKALPLPEPSFPEEPFVEDEDESEELLMLLQAMFSSKRERRVVYLLFHCGLKPREIIHECPQEFSDVHEVYRLRRNIIDRLSRNTDQIRYQLGLNKGKRCTRKSP